MRGGHGPCADVGGVMRHVGRTLLLAWAIGVVACAAIALIARWKGV